MGWGLAGPLHCSLPEGSAADTGGCAREAVTQGSRGPGVPGVSGLRRERKPHPPGARRPQHPCRQRHPRPGPQVCLGALSRCCCCSVARSYPTLCNPTDCSTPGFPVLYHLPSFLRLLSTESVTPSHHGKEEDPGLQRKPTEPPRIAWRGKSWVLTAAA